ncbi:single-stranded-DNA-specific exonuclease RecJ [Eubacteriales bacterium KG127]
MKHKTNTEISPVVLKLLKQRGYELQSDIEEFLASKPKKTYDPFLLLNMVEGVDLVLSAIENDERICIYGDYDADGVTSTSLMLEFLSHSTNNLSYYIPSRFDEGYGLNKTAIKKIFDAGVKLIISVDCGSVSREEVEYGEALGLEFLITDHHKASEENLPYCTVINPNQPKCRYPFKSLSGCGVAFKLAQAVAKSLDLPASTYNGCLDLVAIGTVADIMPLIDENRTLVKYGLLRINSGLREPLKALINGIGLTIGEVTAFSIGFGIGPHLNAAGRINAARLGVQLFRSKNLDDANACVQKMKMCNQKRKEFQEDTYQKALILLENEDTSKGIVFVKIEDAHEGVTGIAAGKLKERFKRPAIIVTPTEEGTYKGTCRSIESIDIHKLLSEFSHLFLKFGGHKAACGFTIQEENIRTLTDCLNKKIHEMEMNNPELFEKTWTWDTDLKVEDISLKLAKDIALMEPFGRENETPKFMVDGIADNVITIGKEGQYRKFDLLSEKDSAMISCVAFSLEDGDKKELVNGRKLSVLGTIDINKWNDKETVQMKVIKFFY